MKDPTDTLPDQCAELLRKSGPMTHLALWGKLGGAKNHPSEVYRAAKGHPDIVASWEGGVLVFGMKPIPQPRQQPASP